MRFIVRHSSEGLTGLSHFYSVLFITTNYYRYTYNKAKPTASYSISIVYYGREESIFCHQVTRNSINDQHKSGAAKIDLTRGYFLS